MQGPKMLPSAMKLHQNYPQLPIISLPATWFLDSNGVTHSNSAHIKGEFTTELGTITVLLSSKKCNKSNCVSLLKAAGSSGELLGKYAQLYAEANEVAFKYSLLAFEQPVSALVSLESCKKKVASLSHLANLLDLAPIPNNSVFAGLISQIERVAEKTKEFSNSDEYKEELKERAISELLIGANGPYQGLRDLIKNSAREGVNGRMVHFLPQKFQDKSDVEELIKDLPSLVPQEISQLEKLTFNFKESFTVYDLIQSWRENIGERLSDLEFDLKNYQAKLQALESMALVYLRHDGEFFSVVNSKISLTEIKSTFVFGENRNLLLLPMVIAIWLAEKYNVTYVQAAEITSSKVQMLLTLLHDGGLYSDISKAWEAVEHFHELNSQEA